MNSSIEIKQLTKQYGAKVAVDRITINIADGELFALLGMNGAGKTTLINMLSTITQPTSGDALLNGKSIVTEADQVKKFIAVSPQETAIAPNLTVRENLELMAGLYGFDKQTVKQKTDQMIQRFSLQPYEKSKSKTLSGGWKRKLSIAMALISDPKILFLDEPTLGLDVLARRELWAVIEKLKEKTTIILTTHYLEEAESLSDRICIMQDGRIKAIGTVSQLNEQAGTSKFEDTFIKLVEDGGQQ
ncbi:ABC transporter ATP-binding protein [Paenibacillus camelliae]|uniref:ABC transporter ATP-binding protein n=1 Tax=Paenibacillus camelliae TaxID=512410 RepID=UPI00203F148C|nr:ABC transporter A family member [Paenibacillus camelliae]MCM3634523.1 ABC transporter A subfamily ATP-binding protein [Paenibacillus camelliae]